MAASFSTMISDGRSRSVADEAGSSTRQTPPPAARVVAFAGRYVAPPDSAPAARIHLLHGDEDRVMPVALAHAAAEELGRLGAEVSLDTLPGVGHEPHPALVERAIARLRAG